jgi:hypothetical protein
MFSAGTESTQVRGRFTCWSSFGSPYEASGIQVYIIFQYLSEWSCVLNTVVSQKIALAWMFQKETNSLHCMGGILADDQVTFNRSYFPLNYL